MVHVFVRIVNLSISASMIVMLILMFRLVLKKYSRRATFIMWGIVALRLVMPFSLESTLGLLPSDDYLQIEKTSTDSDVAIVDPGYSMQPNSQSTINDSFAPKIGNDVLEEKSSRNIWEYSQNNQSTVFDHHNDTNDNDTVYDLNLEKNTVISNDKGTLAFDISFSEDEFDNLISLIWFLGMMIMLLYALIGYIRMAVLTAETIAYDDKNYKNVYLCDRIDTPFIIGVIKPGIILPSGLDKVQLKNVLAHEYAHLSRHDHLWKLLGFILLSIYWFNPVIWLAYSCFCKDMEFACDEQVISGMSTSDIKLYSKTLLDCSTGTHFRYNYPLAFGEVAVEDRIKAALNYKKPIFWIIILVLGILFGTCLFFFTKPSNIKDDSARTTDENRIETKNEKDTGSIDKNEHVEGNHTVEAVVLNNDDDPVGLQASQSDKSLDTYGELTHTEKIKSVQDIFNTILSGYSYSLNDACQFEYVLSNGVKMDGIFQKDSALYFRDYIDTWPEFENITVDDNAMSIWETEIQYDNGYFVVSINNQYPKGVVGYDYIIYFIDEYVHLFGKGESDREYLWSAKFKDGFKPNMYSIRRILFDQGLYDTYVQYCSYDDEIMKPGLYPVNRGYSLDLDGDGTKEKIFVANCRWCGYAENDNMDSWVELGKHQEYTTSSDKYYKGLIYINGKLYIDEKNQMIQGDMDAPVFAVTDLYNNDNRYELLLKRRLQDVFYTWENGSIKTYGEFKGDLISVDTDTDRILPECVLLAEFNGDGTFVSPGCVDLTAYNIPAYSSNVHWSIDSDGSIKRIDGIYEILYSDKEDFLNKYPDEAHYIEDHLERIYLKLTIDLEAADFPDPNSGRTHLEPGYYNLDKTDGKNWIHLISENKEKAGWIDLADLQNYVHDYEHSGLESVEDLQKGKVLFSNLINDPAN